MDAAFWQQHYHKDMIKDIDLSQYCSLIDYFESCVDCFPSRVAFECMGKSLTYSETKTQAKLFCGWLQTHNLGKNKRVAIMLPNCLPYPVTMLGTLYSGATVTNLNPLYTSDELEQQLIDSEASVIVVLENFAATVQKSIANRNTCIEHVVIAKISDFHHPVKKVAIDLTLKHLKKQIPAYKLNNSKTLSQVLSMNCDFTPVKLTKETLAYLLYTGGTTGKPKGVMLSHGNIIANALQSKQILKLIKTKDGSQHRAITALPLYHAYSITSSFWIFFNNGAKNVLLPDPRDLKSFVNTFKKVNPTIVVGVNTLFNLLMSSEVFRSLDFSHLQCSLGGGMKVQKDTAKQWKSLTNLDICQGYGLTEASPIVSVNLPNTPFDGTVGYPYPSTEVKIMNEEDKEAEVGAPGELWTKGPQVMQGYWRDEASTAEVITQDGWLKTRDIAMFNNEGKITLIDRKKHIVNVSGFNVYPNEVEDVLTLHPEISECAVISKPSYKTGESVRAYIVRTEGSNIDSEEINTFLRKYLTGYKSPSEYIFRETLPKTSVGKMNIKALKLELAEELAKK